MRLLILILNGFILFIYVVGSGRLRDEDGHIIWLMGFSAILMNSYYLLGGEE